MLAPPDNFGIVEENIYRCSSINPLSFPFISTLCLKTILFLNPEKPHKPIRSYAQESGIHLNHLGLRPWFKHSRAADWMVFNTELLQDGLSAVLDIRNQPLLIVDSTNAFVGVLRMVLHWNYSSIVAEYRTFSGGKSHYGTEIFLELLKVKRVFEWEGDDNEGEDIVSTSSSSLSTLTPTSSSTSASASTPRRKTDNTLVLTLTSKKYLPEWFIFQHELWLQEVAELNK